jgi:zinc transporter
MAGLVWAYAFVPGEAARPMDADRATNWLGAPTCGAGDEFVWLHFNLANARSEPWLRQHLSLPEAFFESILQSTSKQATSTRVELANESVVAVLNDVQFFAYDTTDASSVSLCADRIGLVTARTTPLRSVDRLRASVKRGEAFRSPAELVAHLLRDQADVLVEIVRKATSDVDSIEDRLIAGQVASCRSKLGSLRRVLVRLQRLLAPEPAALFRLLSRPPSWISHHDVQDLRQSAEELSAAVSDSVALVERVRLLQEELIARVNEQTNRILFILTIVTVLALPLTIIPGLLGMNVGGVPLRDHEGGFWFVVIFLGLVTSASAWWLFRFPNDR